MPEIWLNYGQNEVVLDIQAENLNEKPSDENKLLEDSKIDEKLDALDLSKPIEIAILNYTNPVQQILTKIFKNVKKNHFQILKFLQTKESSH